MRPAAGAATDRNTETLPGWRRSARQGGRLVVVLVGCP
jgi:hypothetical protein